MAFSLPELPYATDALEPIIDQKTMEIHHGKHHQGYTDKLNTALSQAALTNKDIQSWTIEEVLSRLKEFPQELQQAVRNNGGGYYNHCLFWQIMAPEGDRVSDNPPGELGNAIDANFGSFSKFKEQFEQAATSQFGSGWAWLCVKRDGALQIIATPNQDNPLMDTVATAQDGRPILGVDVWEHAYYLKYLNNRGEYLKNWWSVVNWGEVSQNLKRVQQNRSVLSGA